MNKHNHIELVKKRVDTLKNKMNKINRNKKSLFNLIRLRLRMILNLKNEYMYICNYILLLKYYFCIFILINYITY